MTQQALQTFVETCLTAYRTGDERKWEALVASWVATEQDFDRVFPTKVAKQLWEYYKPRGAGIAVYRRQTGDRVREGNLDKVAIRAIPAAGSGERSGDLSSGERGLQSLALPGSQLYQIKLINSEDAMSLWRLSPWMYANGRWRLLGKLSQDVREHAKEFGLKSARGH